MPMTGPLLVRPGAFTLLTTLPVLQRDPPRWHGVVPKLRRQGDQLAVPAGADLAVEALQQVGRPLAEALKRRGARPSACRLTLNALSAGDRGPGR